MEKQPYTPGRVVWRDLMTSDVGRARTFYSELFGWSYETMDMGELGNYDVIKTGDKMIGGIFKRSDDADNVTWMSYVSVPDVDKAGKTASDKGGQLHYGPKDIPNVGRFAVVADADGAIIVPFKSLNGDPPAAMPKPSEFCWETLVTKDVGKATAFYGALFGWKNKPGPGGSSVFAVDDSQQGFLADIQEAKQLRPQWVTYVLVDDLETSMDRTKTLGGKVTKAATEVPEVGRLSLIVDPTGGHLGIFQPNMKM